MRHKYHALVLSILLTFLFIPSKAEAFFRLPEPSARLVNNLPEKKEDRRVAKLKAYLTTYNSPLADHAAVFVKYADTYHLDWRLVASIAGVESWYGQMVPPDSYNGWGWGVYNGNVTSFASWDDGIATISKSLREDYMDKWGAKDVNEIGKYYAADPQWAYKVQHFMDELDQFDSNSGKQTPELSITF